MNLPLIDGAFVIDNSGLEKFKCPRAFEYSEIEQRSPVAERAGANFGSTIHRGLETRYKLCGTDIITPKAAAEITAAMQEWLRDNPQPESDFRNFNHACKMMEVYNHIYPKESFEIVKTQSGKPIIEASFCLPFAEINNIPIYYSGKIDLGIRDTNGLWSFDHKTAFQFGETFDKQMNMDGGQLGYCWALKQVTGEMPKGYIIDAIRVRRPRKMDEFSGVSCIDGTDFKRMPVYVTEDNLEEWRTDVMAIIKNIFQMAQENNFPRHRWQCTNKFGLCDYYDVCSTIRQQRKTILASSLFEENKWSKGLKTANNENKEN